MDDSVGLSRRQWLLGAGAAGAAALLDGCALPGGPTQRGLLPAERQLLARPEVTLPIVQYQLAGVNLGTVLRRRSRPARDLPRGTLARLDRLLRATLKRSGGVGLAAPQVGLARRVVLVQLQIPGRPVLTCVDPRIVRRSDAPLSGYEGCLSIRGVGGAVDRARWVELSYYDLGGRRHTRRSEGWEARIFQHEVDHLNGRLYVDLVQGPLLPTEEMRRRRRLRPGRRTLIHEPGPRRLARTSGEPGTVVLL